MTLSEHKPSLLSFFVMVILVLSIAGISVYPSLSILKNDDTAISYKADVSTDLEKEDTHSCDEESLVDEDVCLYANSIHHIAFYNHFCITLKPSHPVSINRVFLDTRVLPPKTA